MSNPDLQNTEKDLDDMHYDFDMDSLWYNPRDIQGYPISDSEHIKQMMEGNEIDEHEAELFL